ncbi:MIF-like protein mif-2 [Lingula anatina]|uniref:L-dopachrome isomerase n=1 Tax=Lingula anatina TaxID=7574 RepID=A0A1S3HBP6_LINAN|nr:MIF-like protein mif-2 [Lingula anatina]|eukprot:XP_013383443.1 MIF-like protein mif-2 [Lingula anatina]
MPLCRVETNVSGDQIPADFHVKLTQILSKVLDKREKDIIIIMRPNATMYKDCKNVPIAIISIKAAGRFNQANNSKYNTAIANIVLSKLGVEADNLRIFYEDMSLDFIGNGNRLLSASI